MGRVRVALLAALVVLLLAPGAAQSGRPPGTIVGGDPASPGEYPAQGFLRIDIDGDGFGPGDAACGGSLVGARAFLTAAHCAVDDFETPFGPEQFRIYLGIHDVSQAIPPENTYSATAVDVHEAYGGASNANDLAMLTLDRPPPYQPLRLIGIDEASKWAPGTVARIIGWGETESAPYSDVLLEADVPIVADGDCSVAYPSLFDASTMVCAGDGEHDTCQGDSGGPIMILDGGVYELIGVTSWGIGCADPDFPGVYARVGAPALNGWVAARLTTPPPPLPPPPLPPPPTPPPPLPPPPPPVLPPPPPPPVEPPPLPRVVRCAVPQLRGRTLRAARIALVRANCRLGTVRRSYSARVRLGRVMSQRPAAGRRLARYTRVSVVLSRGKRKR